MSRQSYVNGRFVSHGEAQVHVEDRGHQFGDGVYEVWAVLDGRIAEYKGHMDRLERSLDALSIARPMSRAALTRVLREAIRRNGVRDGIVYLQVTRGAARRDHVFPAATVKPGVTVTARSVNRATENAKAAKGVKVITRPDNRWGRCDIKSVGLLPNVLAKQAAKEAGAAEAWLIDDLGFVTEGSSTNAWIVDADGVLRTRDANANILRGITRASLIDLARDAGLKLEERPFTVDEAKQAREAFFTSASVFVMPVTAIDDARIGDGKPGPTATKLRALYDAYARANAI